MGFFDKLKEGLNKTKKSFDEKINNVFSAFRKVDEEFLDELEEALIMSDIGMETSVKIIENLRQRIKKIENKNCEIYIILNLQNEAKMHIIKVENRKGKECDRYDAEQVHHG